jgi:hypothetical protein
MTKKSRNFFSKNIQNIEALYLIRLVSGSLGEPMGWAFMGWKNPLRKPSPTGPTLMG